jgi:hypothetical protein
LGSTFKEQIRFKIFETYARNETIQMLSRSNSS